MWVKMVALKASSWTPPNEKSYIITATSRGLGTSRVPVRATARSHSRISTSGKPMPSAMVRTLSAIRPRRRATDGASGMDCVASGSAVTCSLKRPSFPLHELLGDMAVQVGHLADLLVLVHQPGIGVGAFHEHVIEFPGELHVRHRQLDRFLLLAELLHCHVDDLRGVRHGVVNSLPVHVDDELDTLRVDMHRQAID